MMNKLKSRYYVLSKSDRILSPKGFPSFEEAHNYTKDLERVNNEYYILKSIAVVEITERRDRIVNTYPLDS